MVVQLWSDFLVSFLFCIALSFHNVLIFIAETTVTTIGRLFVTLLVAFSYPIMFLPGRNSMLGLWRFFDRDENAWIAQNKFRYIVITVSVPLHCDISRFFCRRFILVNVVCIAADSHAWRLLDNFT